MLNLTLNSLVAISLIVCGLMPLKGYSDEPFLPKLIIQGSALLYKPADQLNMSLSVVTQDAKAQTALIANNQKMQALSDNLKLLGLEKGEYQTGRFSIQPTYTQPPKDLPADWRSTINGYEVTNTLDIRTKQMQLAPLIIDAAASAGVSQISSLFFDIQAPQNYRLEAITLATANAITDAKALAEAAHLQLIRVLDISLQEQAPPLRTYERTTSSFATFNKEAPITSGEVEIKAFVSITYEIAPLP